MFSVAGNTAIVTGASSGICFSFAELLLSQGCNVVIADIAQRSETKELLAKYKTGSPRAVFVPCDVTSWRALSDLFAATVAEFGDFGLVCPGAGVYEPHWSNFWHPPGSPESRDALDADSYKLLDINLTHPIRMTQLALSHWLYPNDSSTGKKPTRDSPKRIVHISSVAGQKANPAAPLYCAGKYGISGFVRAMEPLEREAHVKVTAVAPGVVRTPLWTEHPEKLIAIDPTRDGWVTAEEVAEAMLRTATDDGFVAGGVLEVGKGQTRLVEECNDPGPHPDPAEGLTSRNVGHFIGVALNWLRDETIWGPTKAKL